MSNKEPTSAEEVIKNNVDKIMWRDKIMWEFFEKIRSEAKIKQKIPYYHPPKKKKRIK